LTVGNQHKACCPQHGYRDRDQQRLRNGASFWCWCAGSSTAVSDVPRLRAHERSTEQSLRVVAMQVSHWSFGSLPLAALVW
jgi:hypothetical protein